MASADPRTNANNMRGTLMPKTMLMSWSPSSALSEADPANTLAVAVMRMTAMRMMICLFIHALSRLPESFRNSRTWTGQQIRIDVALVFGITDGHILQSRRITDGAPECFIIKSHYGNKHIRILFYYIFGAHCGVAVHIIKRIPHIDPGEGIIHESPAPGCIYFRLIRNMDECFARLFVAVLPLEVTKVPGDAADYILGVLLHTEE